MQSVLDSAITEATIRRFAQRRKSVVIQGEACCGWPTPVIGAREDALARATAYAIGEPGYSALLIQPCHKRHAFAMGGIPHWKSGKANCLAVEKMGADKERQAKNGHDESRVGKREDAHAGQMILLEAHEGHRRWKLSGKAAVGA